MTRPQQLQRGETLTGLLVGMALGLVVLAAGVQMLAQLLRAHRLALADTHVQQDLHFAMALMVQDLQNAQYVANAWTSRGPSTCDDAFCDEASDFQLADKRIEFTADRNGNGLQENNECMGFKVADGVLSVRTGCHSGGWQPLSDKASVVVTDLKAQLHCRAAGGWLQRQLTLELGAHWPNEPSRQLQLQRTVPIPNLLPAAVHNRFCP